MQDGGELISNREVAAACRQGIWREKRIRTRRRGMSERGNTSRSSIGRDPRWREKRSGGKRKKRTEGPMGSSRGARAILVSLFVRIFLAHTNTLSPSALFFRRVRPGRGNQPFTRNDAPPPSAIHHHHHDWSRARGPQARTEGNF